MIQHLIDIEIQSFTNKSEGKGLRCKTLVLTLRHIVSSVSLSSQSDVSHDESESTAGALSCIIDLH